MFITDFNNDNYIDEEDLMMAIGRLTQKNEIAYLEKKKIIEIVSTKHF
jgi:hypothetical protein